MMILIATTAMPNLKGGYIPLNKPRINSYKLTNEGYALINLVERVKDEREQPQKPQELEQREEQRKR